MKLPSKRVLSVLVLGIAIVLSVIIVFGDKQAGGALASSGLVLSPGEKILLPKNPNWESELNQLSQDTSGISDQTEITPENQTITDTVATSIFSNYLALRQNGLLNQNSADKLLDQSVKFVEKLEENTPWKVTLKTTKDDGIEAKIKYGENLGNIFKKNIPTQKLNELQIVTEAINQNDPSKIEGDLSLIISVYENIYYDLTETEVPSNFIKPHAEMLNGMSEIIYSLKQIQKIFEDPIVGLQAIKKYQEGGIKFATASQTIRNFLLQNNAIYEQGSGGYYFLYGI